MCAPATAMSERVDSDSALWQAGYERAMEDSALPEGDTGEPWREHVTNALQIAAAAATRPLTTMELEACRVRLLLAEQQLRWDIRAARSVP